MYALPCQQELTQVLQENSHIHWGHLGNYRFPQTQKLGNKNRDLRHGGGNASEVEGKAEIQRLLICSESPSDFDCAME